MIYMILTSTIGGKTIVVLLKTIAFLFETIAIVFKRTRSWPISALFDSMRAHSNRLNEPDPITNSILNDYNLCHWSKSFRHSEFAVFRAQSRSILAVGRAGGRCLCRHVGRIVRPVCCR